MVDQKSVTHTIEKGSNLESDFLATQKPEKSHY